jgi:hypothetical protein
MWIDDALMLISCPQDELAVTTDLDERTLDYVVREAVAATSAARMTPRRSLCRSMTAVHVEDLPLWPRPGGDHRRVVGAARPPPPTGGAFSVNMVGSSSLHLPWCSLNFGATYCSCGVDIAGYPIFEGGWDAV